MIYLDPEDLVRKVILRFPTEYKTRGDVLYGIFFRLSHDFQWKSPGISVSDNLTDDPIVIANINHNKSLKLALKEFINNGDKDKYKLMISHYDYYLKDFLDKIKEVRNNIDNLVHDYNMTKSPLSPSSFALHRNRNFYTAPTTITAEWQIELMIAQELWLPLHHSTHYLDVT